MPKPSKRTRAAAAQPPPGLGEDVVVLKPSVKRFYGHGVPGVQPEELGGRLIVIEGADGSGRSTQIARLVDWLEGTGHATSQVGLKRSNLVSDELDEAKHRNTLSRTTISLFYATDFADQLDNVILPGLRAGYIVLADRYIYTLMARDLVRGMDPKWLRELYGMALVPDAVFYLHVSPENLIERNFAKDFALDYWESGMDLGISRDMFESFIEYQKRIVATFRDLRTEYEFTMIDGDRPVDEVQGELRTRITAMLKGESVPPIA
ncbi:MAG: thymidylate kinase [Verrucomicrobiales bacterium]|nr:thymidylate kinase [Verrucomicrobiales bacterium]